MSDILASVREEILKEDKGLLPWVPKSLDKTWEVQAGLAGALAGAIAGAIAGSHMGLAGPWGAIAGTIPLAIAGGIIGYFSGAKAGSKLQKRGDYILQSRESVDSIENQYTKTIEQSKSKDFCVHCGMRKSAYWDSINRYCSNCKKSDVEDFEAVSNPENLVGNGNFEYPKIDRHKPFVRSIENWEGKGSFGVAIDFIGGFQVNGGAVEGSQYAFIQTKNSSISCRISVEANQNYSLSYFVAGRIQRTESSGDTEYSILLDDIVIAFGKTESNSIFEEKKFKFKSRITGISILKFVIVESQRLDGDDTMLLDWVRINREIE